MADASVCNGQHVSQIPQGGRVSSSAACFAPFSGNQLAAASLPIGVSHFLITFRPFFPLSSSDNFLCFQCSALWLLLGKTFATNQLQQYQLLQAQVLWQLEWQEKGLGHRPICNYLDKQTNNVQLFFPFSAALYGILAFGRRRRR